mmetsp:Transcript_42973/g.79684  ORF Transcript_42973/g.79684 Transcript_42973/m.79684 type:complete len:410 (-) Transcript_42973:650-1879(-)
MRHLLNENVVNEAPDLLAVHLDQRAQYGINDPLVSFELLRAELQDRVQYAHHDGRERRAVYRDLPPGLARHPPDVRVDLVPVPSLRLQELLHDVLRPFQKEGLGEGPRVPPGPLHGLVAVQEREQVNDGVVRTGLLREEEHAGPSPLVHPAELGERRLDFLDAASPLGEEGLLEGVGQVLVEARVAGHEPGLLQGLEEGGQALLFYEVGEDVHGAGELLLYAVGGDAPDFDRGDVVLEIVVSRMGCTLPLSRGIFHDDVAGLGTVQHGAVVELDDLNRNGRLRPALEEVVIDPFHHDLSRTERRHQRARLGRGRLAAVGATSPAGIQPQYLELELHQFLVQETLERHVLREGVREVQAQSLGPHGGLLLVHERDRVEQPVRQSAQLVAADADEGLARHPRPLVAAGAPR